MLNHMKNITFFGMLVVLGLFLFAVPALANDIVIPVGEENSIVNDRPYLMDVPSFLMNGRIYVSSRSLGDYLQADVKWLDKVDYQSITFTKNDHHVVFLLNENNYLVKHKEFYSNLEKMDTCPLLIGEKSYIPAKFLLENLGYKVTHNTVDNSVRAIFTGEFSKEGFTIPLETSIQSVKAYPADILLELVIENNGDLNKQLTDVAYILDSKSIDPLPIINQIQTDFMKGDLNTASKIENKVSLHLLSNDTILLRIWR
ncbi:stalk domain-containing protein [Desulforamulus aeronauticus]|uniref:Copper amine oxidase N-terminal domain-containing protein n=1 Tax=Desulforamulus aeronauticus DSM 10349 TaxID=1121421 RepID=A0A1M6VYI7_9FIRM|nr:stalk domain-containing protein [Desulforamulus aeronauticus]SHK86507.1 Copper amine oxidase N-terminal domain-containing protein [Desulforamulus aeronauticus DSM 10349]